MKIVKELNFGNYANYYGKIAVESANVIVTIYRDSISILDLTNANKRGKRAREVVFSYYGNNSFIEVLLNNSWDIRAIFDENSSLVENLDEYSKEVYSDGNLRISVGEIIATRIKSPFVKSPYENIKPHVSNKLELGTILYESWGYEQTNIDFYCVVKIKNNTITLLPMSSITTENCSFMSDKVVAGEIKLLGNEVTKRVKSIEKFDGFSIKHGWCNMWEGHSVISSHYA